MPNLRTAHVTHVDELRCELWSPDGAGAVPFAPMFPEPRVERVSPGNLVAVATAPGGREAIVWRWFDAVVLGSDADGSVHLWEPVHGRISARPRPSYTEQDPGSRVYASAGLPGADWWVAGCAGDVELADVRALYTDNDLWSSVFPPAEG